jgi:hypothetical protein
MLFVNSEITELLFQYLNIPAKTCRFMATQNIAGYGSHGDERRSVIMYIFN